MAFVLGWRCGLRGLNRSSRSVVEEKVEDG